MSSNFFECLHMFQITYLDFFKAFLINTKLTLTSFPRPLLSPLN